MRNYAVLVGAVLFGCQLASAATTRYVVPPGTPGTPTAGYTSWETAATNIQQAINAAATNDLILVTNGTYYLASQLTITNAITLRSFKDGATDREGTVLDGGFPVTTNRCVFVTNAAAVVDSFTITNGYAATNSMLGYGGGFYLYTKGTVTNCVVAGNQAEARGGGGYLFSAGECRIVDSVVAGNSAWRDFTNLVNGVLVTNAAAVGGGLYSYKSIVSNCTIRGNFARAGGGVYMAAGGNTDGNGQMVDCLIAENTARIYASGTDGGGGIYMYFKGTVANCNIISNKTVVSIGTGYAAGVAVGDGGVLRDSLIAYNTGAGYGGGSMAGGNRTITNCVFRNNSASNGGGVYQSGGLITHCTVVSNNSAAFVQGSAVLRNCLFANNSGGIWANSGGGGTYQNCTIVSNIGTGLQIGQNAVAITGIVENCIVYYNSVTNYSTTAAAGVIFTNSCTFPKTIGAYDVGVVTNAPALISVPGGNYRLTRLSPCVNTGVFRTWMTGSKDLDVKSRIVGSAVDMGAYELPPAPGTMIRVL
jgi:hypothetical protein